MESSRDRTHVPHIGMWILNHWTTGQVQILPFGWTKTPWLLCREQATGGKSRSRGTRSDNRKDAWDDGGGVDGGARKGSDSGFILKEDPTGVAEGKIQVSGTGMPSCSEARTSRKMDVPFIELGDRRKSRFEEGNRKPCINSRNGEIHVACWPHLEVGSSKNPIEKQVSHQCTSDVARRGSSGFLSQNTWFGVPYLPL